MRDSLGGDDHQSMIEAISRLPIEYRKRGTESYQDLLREIGYLESPEEVRATDLVAHLREHPELVDIWLAYSEDKRTSSGWYFRRAGQAGYELGQVGPTPSIQMLDGAMACAEFILRELADFRATAA